MSLEPNSISLELYPRSRGVTIDKQTYDAKSLAKYWNASGQKLVPHTRRIADAATVRRVQSLVPSAHPHPRKRAHVQETRERLRDAAGNERFQLNWSGSRLPMTVAATASPVRTVNWSSHGVPSVPGFATLPELLLKSIKTALVYNKFAYGSSQAARGKWRGRDLSVTAFKSDDLHMIPGYAARVTVWGVDHYEEAVLNFDYFPNGTRPPSDDPRAIQRLARLNPAYAALAAFVKTPTDKPLLILGDVEMPYHTSLSSSEFMMLYLDGRKALKEVATALGASSADIALASQTRNKKVTSLIRIALAAESAKSSRGVVLRSRRPRAQLASQKSKREGLLTALTLPRSQLPRRAK
jgi:hypothetical protein